MAASPFTRVENIDVRDFGAIFDGRDNTLEIQAAIDAAGTSLTARHVAFPAGDSLLSATIRVPSGIYLQGEGSINTRFRRTGDYGDSFRFGDTIFNSGGAKGFCIYQDHGHGLFPPNQPGAFRNLATQGAHIHVAPDSHTRWVDLLLIGLRYQLRRRGGLLAVHSGIDCYGIYDPIEPGMQETEAAVLIEGDSSTIPTDIEFSDCRISGMLSPVRAVSWSGDHVTRDVVQNCGPRNGLQITCCEGLRWIGGYMGACAENAVRLVAEPDSILSGVAVDETFIDSCGNVGLLVDPAGGGTVTQLSWKPSEHNGQSNGRCAITDRVNEDPDPSAYKVPSVIGLVVEGQYRMFVGSGISLDGARDVKIDVTARGWNCRGFYDKDSRQDCFIRLGNQSENIAIYGIFGGGPIGDRFSNHDRVAIRYDPRNSVSRRIGIFALASDGTTLSSGLG